MRFDRYGGAATRKELDLEILAETFDIFPRYVSMSSMLNVIVALSGCTVLDMEATYKDSALAIENGSAELFRRI